MPQPLSPTIVARRRPRAVKAQRLDVISWPTEAPKGRGWSGLAPLGRHTVRSHTYSGQSLL